MLKAFYLESDPVRKMTRFWPCLILVKNKIINTELYTAVRLVNITKRDLEKPGNVYELLKQLIPLHLCMLRFHIQPLVLSLFGLRVIRQNLEEPCTVHGL